MNNNDTIPNQKVNVKLFVYEVSKQCSKCGSKNVEDKDVENDSNAFFTCLDCGTNTLELERDKAGKIKNHLRETVEYDDVRLEKDLLWVL